jgi:hypothetical protein
MRRLRAIRAVASAERGAALVMTLLVLVILTAFGLTLVGLGMTEVSVSSNWRDYSKGFYGAEAALENGVVGLKDLLAATPQPTPDQLNGIAAPTLTDPKLSFGAYSITAPNPTSPTTFASGPYTGLTGFVTGYQVRAQVNGQGGTRADLTQVFQYTEVPLFQFGVFYGKGVDLEIAPGPEMIFNGRVHANSNIYMGAGAGGLNFDSYITTAGSIYRRLKRETTFPWGGDPKIKDAGGTARDLNFDSQYQPGFTSTWANPQAWAAQAASTFGGKVKDSAMGVGEITPPIPELFQNPSNPDVVAHQMIERPKAGDSAALTSAKLYSKAGLRIIDGVATDRNGSSVSLPAGALTTRTFFDARENKTMTAVDVDIDVLRGAGTFPTDGVVYVAGTDLASNPAVRLVNGSRLPSQGLTVVSENPVYVMGDYNSQQKVPAAVMADAITVLSQGWAQSMGESDLGKRFDNLGNQSKDKRKALPTTVNAAFALGPGNESTLANGGNGQLENVIRFIEDWGNKKLNYSGSIIALWHSMQANSQWACCDYYGPPNREWSYDPMFNSTPPPGTPRGVIMMKGRWSQR